MPSVRTREGAAAALAYACVLVLAYNNVVFRGESIVHSNNANMIDYRMTERTYGPEFRPASTWLDQNLTQTANLHDPGATWTQWETGGVYLLRSLRHGELPFWDPYSGGGAPAMANLTQAFFFPPYLLMVLLGNGVLLKNVYFLSLLLTAAWCTWSLLRRSGLSWLASFVGGLAFLLSGATNQTVGSFIGQTVCCLPVGLLATRWFLDRGTWPAAAGLALIFAAVALASFPPVLLAVFGLSAVYAAAEIVGRATTNAARYTIAMRFGVGALLGIGLVAWYYLPAQLAMSASPHVTRFYRDAASQTVIYPSNVLQLLSPALFGGVPVWANDPIPRLTVGVLNYVGVVTLLMVALVSTRELRQPLWLVASVASVCVLGVMLNVPPFAQARELPLLRTIHFGNYYGLVLDFLLALLAAAGFERLLMRGVGPLRGWLAVTVLLAGLLILLFMALGLGITAHPIYRTWQFLYLRVVVLALAAATLMFAAAPDRTSGLRFRIGWAIVILLSYEGIVNCAFPRQKRWDVWAHPPEYVEFLQQTAGLGRVFTMGGALYANSGSAFGIVQLDSLMTFNSPRTFELYQKYAKGALPIFLRNASVLPPEPVLDAAGISHIAVMTDLAGPLADISARGHARVYDDGFVKIFQRAGAERYFFSTAYEVATLKRHALLELAKPRPPRTIIVEQTPAFESRPNATTEVPVKLERFANNSVRLSLAAPSAGFIYVSDSFFPGWRALVNGRNVPIEPANYAFSAVPVPPGPLVVELKYVPPGLVTGLALSVAAFGATVFLIVRSRRRHT